MTAIVEKTLVLSFGEDIVSGSNGAIIAAWDDKRNIGDDGAVKTSFVPGDSSWFDVQHDGTIAISRIMATAGEVQAQGEISLSVTDQLGFGLHDDEQLLSWYPSSGLSPFWHGRVGSGINVQGQRVTVDAGHPCLATFTYSARVKLYRLQCPSMTLAKGDTFPLIVYIYYYNI